MADTEKQERVRTMATKAWGCCDDKFGRRDFHSRSATHDSGEIGTREHCSPCWTWPVRSGRSGEKRGIGFAVALIILGTLLLASSIGWVQPEFIWPIVLTSAGLWMILKKVICGFPMFILGLLWSATIMGWLQADYLWPLALIACGLWLAFFSRIRFKRKAR